MGERYDEAREFREEIRELCDTYDVREGTAYLMYITYLPFRFEEMRGALARISETGKGCEIAAVLAANYRKLGFSDALEFYRAVAERFGMDVRDVFRVAVSAYEQSGILGEPNAPSYALDGLSRRDYLKLAAKIFGAKPSEVMSEAMRLGPDQDRSGLVPYLCEVYYPEAFGAADEDFEGW